MYELFQANSVEFSTSNNSICTTKPENPSLLVLPALDSTWSGGPSEPILEMKARYMWTQSPTGGLFDSNGEESPLYHNFPVMFVRSSVYSLSFFSGFECKPPDPLEFDPELLSIVNSPRTSPDSNESGAEFSMLENWQLNEVFQDIPDLSDVCVESFEMLIEHIQLIVCNDLN